MNTSTVCEWCGRPVELADVSASVKVPRSLLPVEVELQNACEGSLVAVLHPGCWAAVSGRDTSA